MNWSTNPCTEAIMDALSLTFIWAVSMESQYKSMTLFMTASVLEVCVVCLVLFFDNDDSRFTNFVKKSLNEPSWVDMPAMVEPMSYSVTRSSFFQYVLEDSGSFAGVSFFSSSSDRSDRTFSIVTKLRPSCPWWIAAPLSGPP